MNRPLPRFELWGLAALALLGSACTPSNSVQSGAPVIVEMKLIENGASITTIPGAVAECATTGPSAGVNGGMCDPTLPVTICRQTSASNWCRCVANPAPPGPPPPPVNCVDGSVSDAALPTPDAGATDAGAADAGTADAAPTDAAAPLGGTWNCAPFSPNTAVYYVFDRLLDTTTLGDGGTSTVSDLATLSLSSMPATPVTLAASYNSNGAPNATIFPLLGDYIFADGPGLLFMAQPEFPQNSVVSMMLLGTKVRAKDGQTPFAGTGLLDGSMTFTTGAFSGSVASQPTPDPYNVCATTVALDMTPIVVNFDNPVDASMIEQKITLTATALVGGAVTQLTPTATQLDPTDVAITSTYPWPANSLINFTLDASFADLQGDPLVGPVSTYFTTSAM